MLTKDNHPSVWSHLLSSDKIKIIWYQTSDNHPYRQFTIFQVLMQGCCFNIETVFELLFIEV